MAGTARVLIVDDDEQIRDLLCTYLAGFNLETQGVGDGQAMRAALAAAAFDLVVLDVMLPGEDGLTLCRQLRQTSRLPVVMLTARGEASDRIVGLELGADDYVVKPFEPRELVARIRTVLRRARPDGAGTPTVNGVAAKEEGANEKREEIHFAGWRLHRVLRQLVSPEGVVVPLSNAEFRLLWVFLERPRRVLSRDQLLDAARGRTMEAFDRSIDLLVSRLRQKLGEDPRDPRLIKTVRGEGYLFASPVGDSAAESGGGR